MPKACVSLEFICFFIGARREKDKRKRGVGLTRPGETQAANVKQVYKSLPAISRKARFVVAGFPFFFSCVRRARAFFFRSARTHAVLVRSERRLVRFFFVLEEELRPPFSSKQQSSRAGRALPRSRSSVPPSPSVPFVLRATAGPQPVPPLLVSEPGQQKHQVRPGRRFQVIHHFFPHFG